MTITTSTWKLTCGAAALFIAGLGTGLFAARQTVPPSLYIATPPIEAARTGSYRGVTPQ